MQENSLSKTPQSTFYTPLPPLFSFCLLVLLFTNLIGVAFFRFSFLIFLCSKASAIFFLFFLFVKLPSKMNYIYFVLVFSHFTFYFYSPRHQPSLYILPSGSPPLFKKLLLATAVTTKDSGGQVQLWIQMDPAVMFVGLVVLIMRCQTIDTGCTCIHTSEVSFAIDSFKICFI